jgi:hypothetical protein
MPAIHLGNGDVLKVTEEQKESMFEETGTPSAINKDGYQHVVIGVYPDPIKLDKDESSNKSESSGSSASYKK